MKFVHLHTHSKYSLNDAMIDSKSLAVKLKEEGVTKYALTEHGCLMNMPEAYLNLKKKGIELIVGMETYVAPRSRFKKEGREDAANYHLVLLCENNEGYKNLKKIATDAAINGFYYKARTDKEFLKEHSNGLIALSACLGGSVNKFLLQGDYNKAKSEALEYLSIFGKGNYFLEIQRHGLEDQEKINPLIIRLSKETGIPLVCSNDCHYLEKDDWESHDILMAIQAGKSIHDKKRKIYTSHEFYVKSQIEMINLFSDIPEAIDNTVKIANRCHVDIDFETNKLPPFKAPSRYNNDNLSYFSDIVYEGAKKLYGELTDEIVERIEYEKEIIHNMGFVNYFLITWDFFRFCEEGTYEVEDNPSDDWEPLLTGPGRGSCAGSIISYCMGITKIDPLKYDLLFERFLDPSRISFPDIDSDFDSDRRQEVIDYAVYKYGRENIAQIITYMLMAARSVIRRVGKALDMNLAFYDRIAKMIPQENGITIKKALEISEELSSIYNTNPEARTLLDFSMKLEGIPNSTSTHAAGVLITDSLGVTEHVPMWVNKEAIVAQFDKNILESMKLLKMDFLGLRNLSVINEARKFIKKNHGKDIDLNYLYSIPDLKPLELVREGKTAGIFQLESQGMTNFMKDLAPKDIEDLTAGISMFRPGPLNEIPRFLRNRRNPSKITYEIDGLERILSSTSGVLIYQEQAMMAVVHIAGYQKSDSDGFRKVIAKKIEKLMPLHKRWFIYGRKEKDYNENGELVDYTPIPGGIALGHNKEALEKFFDEMKEFGKYCFNKSHAVSYAYLAYVTAWFMYYYPVEFMAAILNSVQGKREKVAQYISYARKTLNIEISEPCINKSVDKFIPSDGKIYYTLKIKGASSDSLEAIVKERRNDDYTSFLNFIVRTRKFLNKGTYEALIASGAFKEFGIKKSVLLAGLDDFWEKAYKKSKDMENKLFKKDPTEKFDFYNSIKLNIDGIFHDINEFPKSVELKLEKEFLGLYLTDNPLYQYSYTIKTIGDFKLSDLDYDVDELTGAIIQSKRFNDRQTVKFVGVLNSINELITKKKTLMARPEIEDLTSTMQAIIWPKTYSQIKNTLSEGTVYIFEGYIENNDDKPSLFITECNEIDNVVIERIIVEVNNSIEAKELINDIKETRISKGITPIYINYDDKQIVLTRDYWVNKDYILKNYNSKIEVW